MEGKDKVTRRRKKDITIESPASKRFQEILRYLKRDKKTALALLILLTEVIIAIFAPYVAPYPPNKQIFPLFEAPSSAHPLGTDSFGRDLLSRLIFGSRISLTVGIIAISFALVTGIPLALISGYYGGTADMLIMRFIDLLWAFPKLLLAVALMAILGQGLINVLVAIGVAYIDDFARLVRGMVLSLKEEEFILAAKALGSSDRRIMFRHLLPNSIAPVIVQATVSISYAMLTEATLSFLGIGVPITTPSWGLILSEARGSFSLSWWLAIFPGLAIMITVLSINFVGDALRDIFDVKVSETEEV